MRSHIGGVIVASIGFLGAGQAQTIGTLPDWTWQNPRPTGSTLNAAAALNSSTRVIVGDSGSIFRTTDGGETWTQQASGTNNNLRAVAFADANHGIAVGDKGTILATKDAGTTWISQWPVASFSFRGVAYTDPGNATVVGY